MNTSLLPGPGEAGRTATPPASGWVTAVVAGAAGIVVTALGAGIAVRHLLENGVTWTSGLGLVALASGVALLVLACRRLWRAGRGWQRLWFVPAVVVALPVMFSLAEGAMLAYGPRVDLDQGPPSVRGVVAADVTFRTSDGVLLSAWYVPSRNRAAIVTVPGAGSNRTATVGQAVVLARHGYGVLMVDPRGQGRSGGRAMDAGWYGDRDLTAAVRFLQHRYDVDPTRVGVLGLSMGGEEAIGAAAADPAIRAVVAEGATHRTAADKAGYLPGGLAGALQRGLDRITYGTAALLSPAPQPTTLHEAIPRARSTAFLLIAAGRAVDEPEAAAYLSTAAPDRVLTWTVPDATHTHGLSAAPEEWAARVTSFFDRSLGIQPAGSVPGDFGAG
jgi:dienelactone hydrolase